MTASVVADGPAMSGCTICIKPGADASLAGLGLAWSVWFAVQRPTIAHVHETKDICWCAYPLQSPVGGLDVVRCGVQVQREQRIEVLWRWGIKAPVQSSWTFKDFVSCATWVGHKVRLWQQLAVV